MKSPAPFPAVLLAGGFGTRLRSVVSDLPKPLAPVHGRPFITYLLDQLIEAGFSRTIVCLHHHAEKIIAALGPRYRTLDLDYSIENEPVGTGGALRLAIGKADALRYLTMNADSFCAAKLADFISFHCAHDDPASLVSIEVPDTARYGALQIGKNGRLEAFSEKDGKHQPGVINGGIYLIEQELAKSIPEGRSVSLEREVFPLWLEQGFMAWTTETPFIDIGVPESYAEAQTMDIFASPKAE